MPAEPVGGVIKGFGNVHEVPDVGHVAGQRLLHMGELDVELGKVGGVERVGDATLSRSFLET